MEVVVYGAMKVNEGIRLESREHQFIRTECAVNHIVTFVVDGFLFPLRGHMRRR